MSDINNDMQDFALEIKRQCTERGYTASICLADGLGHGEFYHNIEEVDYSMIRFIEKNGNLSIHFKSHMSSKPVETNKSLNALVVLADILGYNAMTFLESAKQIAKRIEIEKEESKIIPFKGRTL